MSTSYDYDLVVIGAGSGGVRAARMSASRGAKVAIIESRYLGGTCVNVGCVPKKLFVYASEYAQAFEDSAGYGYRVDSQPTFDWATLRDNKTAEIQRLNGVYDGLLGRAGVEIILGHGRFVDDHTVEVDGQKRISAAQILIATGTWPTRPDIPGAELGITSNEVFYLDTLPDDAIVVGGGYIAVEFAGIFNGLGVSTHLVYRGEPVLRGFDREVRDFVSEQMAQAGVDLQYNRSLTKIEKLANGRLNVTFDDGGQTETGLVLFATGRDALVDGLDLNNTGVTLTDNGFIAVDDRYRTAVPHIRALGDVIGRVPLTPVAIAEGMFISADLFGDESPRPVDYNQIPTAVFCQPNVGTVGLTEEAAAEQFDRVEVYSTQFRAMRNTLSGNPGRTLMKMLVDAQTQRVLGLHMVGDDAGEIIQGLAVAMNAGATKADFDRTIGIHPTSAEEFVTMREPSRIVGRSV
ncbi:glutathione-disulfide reductase [Saccharospirillum mangrovi]|uniref:glutathione-disulfide reductase n=1 Tax=Saccharospirillum mangrovi TaxID=2161747 RepID=UPI000D34DBED|nr:glutathione-disulfide reductase [Saccharospirillum mangrovi]